MANLKQLKFTLGVLGIDSEKVDVATEALTELAQMLEDIPVKGRDVVDQMLGCMMGIEQIIGNEEAQRGGRCR